MKKRTLTLAAAALLAAACTPGPKSLTTTTVNCEESTKYVSITMNLELPSGNDKAAQSIKQSLIGIVAGQLASLASPMEEEAETPEGLNEEDISNLFNTSFIAIENAAKSDYNERSEYILSDSTMTDTQKQQIIDDWPGWECTLDIKKEAETPSYAVFSSINYVYMGGAHGGVGGAGYLTYDLKTGELFTDFLKDGCFEEIKPLVRKGLCEYLSENGEQVNDENLDEYLFDENGPTVLPSYSPYPTENGLSFIYQQYEIAPYAMGMPSFTISYKELENYLTENAKKLIQLQ